MIDAHIDYKVTVWRRAKYRIPNDKWNAFKKEVKLYNIDTDTEEFIEDEVVYETQKLLSCSENNGFPTIELFKNDELVWNNDDKQFLSC